MSSARARSHDDDRATQSGAHPGPAGADTGEDQLAKFTRLAAQRRALHSRTEPGRAQDWADPDPGAVARLVPAQHPVDRAVRRSKAGRTRESFRGRLRLECERLLGAPPRSLTMDDLRAYPWHHLDQQSAADYREAVYATYRHQTTRNDIVCAVRRVVRECYKVGLISALRRDLVLEQLYTVTPGASTKRRRLTQAEIDALMATCQRLGTPAAQARNTAIVALFRTSGMRISELAAITLADWDREAHTITLRDTKNGKPHTIWLHPEVPAYLDHWMRFRGEAAGVLFCPLTGADKRPLHAVTIRYMLATRAKAAGIRPFGSHDFRRTFATELLRTHDVVLVGKLLNHNKPESTLRYDMSEEAEQRSAVAQLQLLQHTCETASNGGIHRGQPLSSERP